MKVFFKVLLSNLNVLLSSLVGLMLPQGGKKILLLVSAYAGYKNYTKLEDFSHHEIVAIKRSLGYFKGCTIEATLTSDVDLQDIRQWLDKHQAHADKICGYINGHFHERVTMGELITDGRRVELILDLTTSAGFVMATLWRFAIWPESNSFKGPLILSAKAPWAKVLVSKAPRCLRYARSNDIIEDATDLLRGVGGSQYQLA